MSQFSVYFNKFKSAILISIAALLLTIFLITKIIPIVQGVFQTNAEVKTQSETLADKQRTLDDLKVNAEKMNDKSDYEKAFYKPIESGLDTEAVMAYEFNEILQLIRANSVKMRSIKYDYNPADDNFVKGAATKFDVSRMDMQMVADYKDFEGFLKDLYKHEHFLDIAKIEVTPYSKDKKVLLINFQLKLYAEKS